MALPMLKEGKIWSGKASWIASEPIEVGFLIKYNINATDNNHSKIETLKVNNIDNIFGSTNLL